MVETERVTFAVVTTGVGRPDYAPEVAVGTVTTRLLQQRLLVTWTPSLPVSESTTVLLYTVPTGYKLTIGSVLLNCELSIIQKFNLYSRTVGIHEDLIEDHRWDMQDNIILGPETALIVDAGGLLYANIHNNDPIHEVDFSVNLQGVLEQVGAT